MSAEDYSRRIEALLRKVNGPYYRKSDEILLNPYEEIISGLIYRLSKEKLDWFKLNYQAINNKTLKDLLDEDYDVELLIKDLRKIIENNFI